MHGNTCRWAGSWIAGIAHRLAGRLVSSQRPVGYSASAQRETCTHGRVSRRVSLVALLASAVFLAFSAPALAIEAHTFGFRFGLEVNETKVKEKAEGGVVTEAEENLCTAVSGNICKAGQRGGGGGQLEAPHSLAVSDATGDIYVTDPGNSRVDEFSVTGKFVLAFGGEVNATTRGDVCTQVEIETKGVECEAGERGSGTGEFNEDRGIAVDNSADSHRGDVYVADPANNRIQVFSASGLFLEEINGGETPSGSFSSPRAVAVNPVTGDLYVADSGDGLVAVFEYNTTEAKYKYIPGSEIKTSQTEFPEGIAVDASGNVYVQNGEKEVVSQFNSAGVYQYTLATTHAIGVAVNTKTNDVYVGRRSAGLIAEYGSTGSLIQEFGVAITGEGNFVAVNSTNGDVYDAEEESNDVDMFEPTSETPGVSTGGATNVTETSATLNGSLEPFGFATTYYFEYGTTESYGSVAPVTPASAGTTAEDVSESISGLLPNTTYYYRLVGEAGSGAKFGSKETFRTLAPAPGVTTGNATNVTQTSATLSGEVNPEGARTEYSFTYVAASQCFGGLANYDGFFCAASPVPNSTGVAGAGTTPVQETVSLAGLDPDTTYYYEITATNGTQSSGAPHVLVLAPGARTLGPGEVHETSAVVYAALNPPGAETTYQIEYGTTPAYGSASANLETGVTSGYRDVAVELDGLQAGVTYHYRIVASTVGGTVYGQDATFMTTMAEPYPVAPTATTGTATNVSANGATVTGVVEPDGWATTYRFEYGATTY
jgi:DNA-binding beta-propeller fold protein YncE